MKLVISLLAVVLLCAAFVTAAGGSKGTTGTKVISGYTWCILTIPGGMRNIARAFWELM